MKLYLAQHGDATPKEENPDRPLSKKGRADVRDIARFLSHIDTAVARVMHSGKLRAKQTAEMLAEQLAPGCTLEINEHINPLDSPVKAAKEITQHQDDILLVGHLPHLAKLATLLLTGHEEPMIVTFSPGVVACLERSEDKHWSVICSVSPEMTMDNN